ncbi:MAG: AsmA family protein [Methylotenera sp.]
MKKSKKILIGVAVVIGLLLILPFLIPIQTYLHQAEKIASEKLGVPVTINSAHLFLLPSPRVVASDITAGAQQELKIESLVVIPTIGSLFSATKIIDLNISKPIVNKAALEIISALTAKKSESSEAVTAVNIRHIKIDELQLVWPDAKYPMINAEATLTSDNKLESAVVETVDGKLKANVTPSGGEQLIMVNVDKWTLPVGLPLLIDKAKLEMHLKGSKLTIPKIDVALYSGKLTGNAVLSWQENKGKTNWRTNGNFRLDNLSVKQPSSLVSKSVYLSGNLFGSGIFSATAKEAGQLADNLQTNFQFKVNNGVLHGLDLVKVASLLLKQSQSGGETQFDEFSGVLNTSGKQYHLRDIKISSGLLSAKGQVKVKPNKALDGTMVVDVKNSMGLTAIPLDVSGTVSKPVVLPSKAAIAGAVAGTAILGPGVGTSLGIRAGGAIDKLKGLFGDKK